MVFKLLQSAQKNWNRLKGFELLTLVVNNLPFKDGQVCQGGVNLLTAFRSGNGPVMR